jgi:hypothetical protein
MTHLIAVLILLIGSLGIFTPPVDAGGPPDPPELRTVQNPFPAPSDPAAGPWIEPGG